MIYFDNAATTYPKPPRLLQAMQGYLMRYGANPGRGGHAMSMETAQEVYQVREAAARLLGVGAPENIVFTQNCTHSLNLVIQGLLKPGDHAVISDLEHNSVLRPVHRLWKERGVEYTVAETVEGDGDATVESFRRCLRPNTKLVICTHGSNVFGIKLPIQRLAELAHQNGALFLADCAQTAGVEEISLTGMGLDFVAAPGHKGLYGPTGTGLLAVGGGVSLAPLMQGGTGSNSMAYDQPDFLPDQLESGTVNTLGILALGEGIAEVQRRGVPGIRAHEMRMARALYDGLSQIPSVRLYTRRPEEGTHLPVLSFTVNGQNSEETAAILNQYGIATRAGYHCSPLAHQKMGTVPTGTVRLSLGMYNTMDEVRECLDSIRYGVVRKP